MIYENHRFSYSKLFERTSNSVFKTILFNDYDGVETPRVFSDENYEIRIPMTLKRLVTSEFLKQNITRNERILEKTTIRKVSIRHTVSRRMDTV